MDELLRMTARQAVSALKNGDVTPLDLIAAAEARVGEVEPVVNALPTTCFDRARERAEALMESPPRNPPAHFLHGLPIAIKDLTNVAGVRTTQGSPIFADFIPERSDILVERLEQNGAIVIGKSNTPEFGAGSHTFNEVFGHTRNPWNPKLSAGGSSGGAAAALASGSVWLASGSDLGGSLRNPASFCSVVGLRPSPGRVAHGPNPLPFNDLSVDGPMARTVGDVALMLDAMTGAHPEDPVAMDRPAVSFMQAHDAPQLGRRIAFSPDLGIAPVAPEVAEICRSAAKKLAMLTGSAVKDACPDFSDAAEIFHVLRANQFALSKAPLLDKHRERLKEEVIWNIEAGLALTPQDIARAQIKRGALFNRVADFFKTHDLLLCPAAILPPFDGSLRYPTEVAGRKFETYIDWLIICSAISLTTCPAISVPCGFTSDKRPVGLQIVGPPRGEAKVIAAAAIFESAVYRFAKMTPIDPKPAA